MQLFRPIGLILILLGIGVMLQFASAQTRLTSAENSFFEIVGQDTRSVRYVDELSQYIVETKQRYFSRENMNFPQQILVNLRPLEYVNFDQDYQVRIASGGFVTLDLRWSESLAFQTCIRALTEAFFVRYALFNHGPESLESLPEWPISAISTMAYLRLRPALWGELARSINQSIIVQIEGLLTRDWDSLGVSGGGYWFLHSLGEFCSLNDLRLLINRAVAGVDIIPEITLLLGEELDQETENSLQLWWHGALERLPQKGSQIYETMEVSRTWIDQFAKFESDGQPISLRELWNLRKDEDLRSIVEARYDLIRIRMPRVNPAYFNAGRSLGALFETLLEDGPIFEYIGNLAEFLSDFEDTKVLEQNIRERL